MVPNKQAAKELVLAGGSVLTGSALGLALVVIPPATLVGGFVILFAHLAPFAIPFAFRASKR